MINPKLFLSTIVLTMFLVGCELLDRPQLPPWDVELLGPLTKSEISLAELSSSLSDFDYSTKILMGEVFPGFEAGTPYPFIPAFSNISAGPFELQSSDYGSVTFESGNLVLILENKMPVDIVSATLEVKSGGQVLFTQSVGQVASGSVFTSAPISMAGKKLGNKIESSITNLSTAEKNTPGVIGAQDGIGLEMKINNPKLEEVQIKTKQSFEIADESPINFETDEISTKSIIGKINFLAENGLSLETKVQVYFLNTLDRKIDSLFSGGFNTIASAELDSEGRPIRAQKTTLTTELGPNKYDMLKDAKSMRTEVKISVPTGASSVILNKKDVLLIKTVGDLKLRISK